MARYLVKIVGLGAQAMGRAFVKTLRQEIEAFNEAARLHQALNNNEETVADDTKVKGMTLTEARLILNVKDLADTKKIDTNYKHLFQANEKPSGGTFYLQSKVYRAKERIDQELAKLQAACPDGVPPSSAETSIGTEAEAQFGDKKPGPGSRRD
ncbi:hypothetical protein KR054_007105 [Drosophila jambulina]|nr:hypothetical protein KR054_007105 [Drosophila jambulina]